MQTAKQEAIEIILKLPDKAGMDEILNILNKTEKFHPHMLSSENIEKELSCLDTVRDIIGCIEGPDDISTNKVRFNR